MGVSPFRKDQDGRRPLKLSHCCPRIAEFRAKYPEGSLQPVSLEEPFKVLTIGDKSFITYVAAAYRTPDDKCPGVGVAWEPFPGRTPYTRDSELMNAETSAWGRAIVAALAADTTVGIATQDEIRNRQASVIPPRNAIRRMSANSRIAVLPKTARSTSWPICRFW